MHCLFLYGISWQQNDTWACLTVGVAGLTGPVNGVVVVSLRARGQAAAFFPHEDETRSAAQAAVVPVSDALAATWFTLLAQPCDRVSIVTTG